MRSTILTMFAATTLALAAPAAAQPSSVFATAPGTPGAQQPLDLATALALADGASPRLRIAESQVEGARSGVLTARQYPNPEALASAGQQNARVTNAPNGSLGLIGLSQQIDLPMVREPRIRGAEAGVEGSELALAETRLVVRANVKQAFYDALRRKAEFELALENQRLFQQIRDRIAVRVNVGEAPRFELTRADAELSTAANVTNSARLRVAQAVATLRAVIGAPLPPDFEPVGSLQPPPALPSLVVLREEALLRYPAIPRADAEVKRAQARLETERALRIPQPTLRADYEREPEVDKYRIGISIPIPIFNQRQGQIGEAVAAFQQATLTAEQTRIEVRAAMEAAYSRYEVAATQIAQFEGGLLKQAESALSVAEAAFRFGERGFIDVLDAQRVLRQVRNDFLAARFDQQAALVEIERLRAADYETRKP
jgi:outer membrane protein, heavy metal efflux system